VSLQGALRRRRLEPVADGSSGQRKGGYDKHLQAPLRVESDQGATCSRRTGGNGLHDVAIASTRVVQRRGSERALRRGHPISGGARERRVQAAERYEVMGTDTTMAVDHPVIEVGL